MLIFASFDYNARTEKTSWKLSLPVKLLDSLELLYSNILHLGGWVSVLSPFLIGRMFLREPSWKYSAKLVGS